MSSRERRVLLWAELTAEADRSLLVRCPEGIAGGLFDPMLVSNLETKCLKKR